MSGERKVDHILSRVSREQRTSRPYYPRYPGHGFVLLLLLFSVRVMEKDKRNFLFY